MNILNSFKKNNITEFYYNIPNDEIFEILSVNTKIQNVTYKNIGSELHLIIKQTYKIEFINNSFNQGAIITNNTFSFLIKNLEDINTTILDINCNVQKIIFKFEKKQFIYISTLLNIEYKL
ncbi:MAG: hypothetical protein ACRCYC_10350 [Paraclostridium sp.]|uniref:hypothetical protein n=1 Tax=Paraclostridium sp. TaxID=2023273 RepID=UPI003F3171B7